MGSEKYWILLFVGAYLLGNISPSIILSKIFLKSDIRAHGSGNAGATNVRRVMGNKAGTIVFLLDMFKGMLPTIIGAKMGGAQLAYLCGIAVVLGHVFPIFLKFKGGKGVATSFGAALIINPLFAILSISVFALIVWRTRYVSLGSILGTCTFPLLSILFGYEMKIVLLSMIFALIIVFSHRENIKKLLSKTENKLS
ncbi:MAG: glycerol-3-phosphate 1-O-acyltransferase PlsY [Peptostreptococcaceae bacterium]|nr:glycerol-3-phosphate 1-O-acyltransferase PlsY [Peptostreptococcaceae bacterium]